MKQNIHELNETPKYTHMFYENPTFFAHNFILWKKWIEQNFNFFSSREKNKKNKQRDDDNCSTCTKLLTIQHRTLHFYDFEVVIIMLKI